MSIKTTLIPGVGIIIISAIMIILHSCGQAAVPSRSNNEKAIKGHIDKMVHGYMNKDRATVMATHPKNWRGFFSRSTQVLHGIDDYMDAAFGPLTEEK